MTNPNLITIPAAELVEFNEEELMSFLGSTVVIHIVETENGNTAEAKVVGTVELFTLIEGGVALKLYGSDDPIPVGADELDNVTITTYSNGVI